MHGDFTAVVEQNGNWWIGWIEEIPGVNCQERTREELVATLAETLPQAIVETGTQHPPRARRRSSANWDTVNADGEV